MIRYPITEADLRERIRTLKPSWFTRTRALLVNLPESPRSADFRSLWSEIKDVYVQLQHSKCAFCEKSLEGAIEQDVEHFRPKAEVEAWPAAEELAASGVVVRQPTDGSKEKGYRNLAYHPLNYAAACKNCNTIFKGNYFPIAGTRKSDASHPPSRDEEEPLLIYPIGDADDDPEDLITFEGIVPRPRPDAGRGQMRALVTIALFKLDDPLERKIFFQQRALALEALWFALEGRRRAEDEAERREFRTAVDRMIAPSRPFAVHPRNA